jgi:hypothetical protein
MPEHETAADKLRRLDAKHFTVNGIPLPQPDEWPEEQQGDMYHERAFNEGLPPSDSPEDAAEAEEPALSMPAWPDPPTDAAYHGLAGDIVRAINPQTESDPVALLGQFLVAFGNAIGRTAFYPVEAHRHYSNLFLVLVGRTAKGRKGTSWGWVKSLFTDEVAPGWMDRIQTGLSSGEGLIWAVRDEIRKNEPIKTKGRITGQQEVVADEGVSDKRLMVVEEEFSQVLRQASREGNTLSAIVRQAWDGGRLRSLTKNSPAKATDAHISIIGHITQQELVKALSETDTANGFANRFLWICSKRSKLLPDGGILADLSGLQDRVRSAVQFAKGCSRVVRNHDASALWHAIYESLSAEQSGIMGFVTNRAEAQVLRLSVLYALLDEQSSVHEVHLRAGIALWEYAERSCRWIFGESTGNRDADLILEHLVASGDMGMSLTEVTNLFGRHKTALEIRKLLKFLELEGKVIPGERACKGKAAKPWRAAGANANPAKAANPLG